MNTNLFFSFEVKECNYKGEHYSVRDNGEIMRHRRKGTRRRKLDEVWTFGTPNLTNGYALFCGEGVHRIVATAFHGEAPSSQYVVDHIDTNRRNNRPENLRWVTRIENVLKNPITRARIENLCGSIKVFLANPSILRGHEKIDPNFSWMRAVSPEEARVSLERLTNWAKESTKPKGGGLGEWIYQERKEAFNPCTSQPSKMQESNESDSLELSNEMQSLTPNAMQIDWRIPSEFPCCPRELTDNPLKEYLSNLKVDAVFCKNNIYSSLVVDCKIIDEGNFLCVMTRSEKETTKPWALAKIFYKEGVFFHENMGAYFEKKGAEKYFTLMQGKEWMGGDVLDDYC